MVITTIALQELFLKFTVTKNCLQVGLHVNILHKAKMNNRNINRILLHIKTVNTTLHSISKSNIDNTYYKNIKRFRETSLDIHCKMHLKQLVFPLVTNLLDQGYTHSYSGKAAIFLFGQHQESPPLTRFTFLLPKSDLLAKQRKEK